MKALGYLAAIVLGALVVAVVMNACLWLSTHHVARTIVVGVVVGFAAYVVTRPRSRA